MFIGVNIHVLFYIFSGFQVACFIYQELGDVGEGPDILDMRSERILGLHLGPCIYLKFICLMQSIRLSLDHMRRGCAWNRSGLIWFLIFEKKN